MSAAQDQNRTALRRFGRWLVLPLLLAMLVFLQTGLREALDPSAQHRPELAAASTAHLAALKPAKPDLRLRAADLLLPETTVLPDFLPQSRAANVAQTHVTTPLGINTGWNARAPPLPLA